MRRKAFDSTLSKKAVSGTPPQKKKNMRRILYTRTDKALVQS
ncbi:hypothetical protein E2C01_022552 [Portunus trituberculatus]|uniref:Uncharacterized protein n=1 Tax=Portunus trituberculatus TaxID=210409 RepID=A0A5B7E968_PORTR|nr:hypothetical protein [Portunus trituberculatus]